MRPKIVLASGSPRRRELLAGLGVPFEVKTSQVDETFDPSSPPNAVAEELAHRKAKDVARQLDAALVIGADTIVVCDGEILGKPRDEQEAVQMLSRLQGRAHQVYTGIALVEVADGHVVRERVSHRMTHVWMRSLSDEKISWYVDSKEPLDKAGAYGIQGLGACLIDKIDGCYFNVVGLSLVELDQMFQDMGYSLVP
ncbi:Maf family protein [Laceyella sacchari]|jgi:septum formation protein|uniref:dTTP/UTP pyrophosphatase n=1 Tax=Laceyella sacchari TaxID=37482 RepID=A0ABY5U684_LACSH|nr:Maf family protein [Laceyella sacchari]TCW41077.1 septum formation protein [Laceyella sacchari]UWE04669.1 Maf family protein [Laceyella sacchari]